MSSNLYLNLEAHGDVNSIPVNQEIEAPLKEINHRVNELIQAKFSESEPYAVEYGGIPTKIFWIFREVLYIARSAAPSSLKGLGLPTFISTLTVSASSFLAAPLDIVTASKEISEAYREREKFDLTLGVLKFLQGVVSLLVGMTYLAVKPLTYIATLKNLTISLSSSSMMGRVASALTLSVSVLFIVAYLLQFLTSCVQGGKAAHFLYHLDKEKSTEILQKETDFVNAMSDEECLNLALQYVTDSSQDRSALILLGKEIAFEKSRVKLFGFKGAEIISKDPTQATTLLKHAKIKELFTALLMGGIGLAGMTVVGLMLLLGTGGVGMIVFPSLFIALLIPVLLLEIHKLQKDLKNGNISKKHNEKMLLGLAAFSFVLTAASILISLHFGIDPITLAATSLGGGSLLGFYIYAFYLVRKGKKREEKYWKEILSQLSAMNFKTIASKQSLQ